MAVFISVRDAEAVVPLAIPFMAVPIMIVAVVASGVVINNVSEDDILNILNVVWAQMETVDKNKIIDIARAGYDVIELGQTFTAIKGILQSMQLVHNAGNSVNYAGPASVIMEYGDEWSRSYVCNGEFEIIASVDLSQCSKDDRVAAFFISDLLGNMQEIDVILHDATWATLKLIQQYPYEYELANVAANSNVTISCKMFSDYLVTYVNGDGVIATPVNTWGNTYNVDFQSTYGLSSASSAVLNHDIAVSVPATSVTYTDNVTNPNWDLENKKINVPPWVNTGTLTDCIGKTVSDLTIEGTGAGDVSMPNWYQPILDFLSGLLSSIIGLLQSIWDLINNVWNSIKSILSKLSILDAMKGLLQSIMDLINSVWDTIKSILSNILSLPLNIANKIKDIIIEIFVPTLSFTEVCTDIYDVAITRAPFSWFNAFYTSANVGYGDQPMVIEWQPGLNGVTVGASVSRQTGLRTLSTVLITILAIFTGYAEIRRWIG